ncbi:MAG: 30S ribosome-binding factor RbfA [candidate division NC10 bacterium]|nr:30S ribosome-binding factor RbfA [candidate division NC10 bacterium]
MRQNRADRVSGLLKEEISRLIQKDLKDPRVGFVTITRVSLSRDLRYAKVFFSTYGDQETQQRSLEGLQSALGFIRGELGRRLDLRFIPEIEFHIDGSVEYAFRIEEIIHQIKKGRGEEV